MLPSPVVLKSRGEGTYVLDSAHLLALKKWSEVALLGGTPPRPQISACPRAVHVELLVQGISSQKSFISAAFQADHVSPELFTLLHLD